MKHWEKTLITKPIYQGRILSLRLDTVELQDGRIASREVVEHNGGVAVLAVDRDNSVLFVRQFRYPYGEELLELPAGKLNPGEDPALCGRRELEEETGCTAGDYRFLAKIYPSPGYVDEVIYVYLARDLTLGSQHLDPGEFLTVKRIPLEQAVSLCLEGSITDAKTLLGILKYNELRRRGEVQ